MNIQEILKTEGHSSFIKGRLKPECIETKINHFVSAELLTGLNFLISQLLIEEECKDIGAGEIERLHFQSNISLFIIIVTYDINYLLISHLVPQTL